MRYFKMILRTSEQEIEEAEMNLARRVLQLKESELTTEVLVNNAPVQNV